jgi:hypothetical protein
VVGDQGDLTPPVAETPSSCAGEQSDRDHGNGVDQVVVDELVHRRCRCPSRVELGGRLVGEPHHQHHHRTADRHEPHRDPRQEGETDTEKAGHEQPIHQHVAGQLVKQALERSDLDVG